MTVPSAVRPLLLVLAALALVLTGGVEPAPRPGPAGTASWTSAQAGASDRASTDSSAPARVLRAGLAPSATPTPAGGGLLPSAGPLLALHLRTSAQGRPPTAPGTAAVWAPAAGRAPPTTTGT